MKRELTIEEVERQPDNAPMWVINKSGEHELTKQIGELVLQIPIPDQAPEQIVLPATWLPVNLTERVPRKHLISTTILRRYYGEGLIMFITPEYAKLLNEHEGAEEEREALRMRRSMINKASSAKTLENTPGTIMMDGKGGDVDVFVAEEGMRRGRIPDIDVDTEPSVSRFSAEYEMWKVDVSRLNDIQTLNSLRTRGRSFTRAELIDLVETSLSNKPKTRDSVLRNLNRRRAKGRT